MRHTLSNKMLTSLMGKNKDSRKPYNKDFLCHCRSSWAPNNINPLLCGVPSAEKWNNLAFYMLTMIGSWTLVPIKITTRGKSAIQKDYAEGWCADKATDKCLTIIKFERRNIARRGFVLSCFLFWPLFRWIRKHIDVREEMTQIQCTLVQKFWMKFQWRF